MSWREIGGGLKRKVFTDEGVTVCLHLGEPGSQGLPHKHMHEQICYIIRGEAELHVEKKVYNLKEGDLLYIPPNAEHYGFTIGNESNMILDVFAPLRTDYL